MKKLFMMALMFDMAIDLYGGGGGAYPIEAAGFNGPAYAMDGEDYTGLEDEHIDFGGQGASFNTEHSDGKSFSVAVENTTTSTKRVSFGAALEAVAGTTQLKEGTVVTGVTCNGSPKSYDVLKDFIKLNPTRLIALKVQSSNEEQLSQSLIVTRVSPFENLGSKNLNFSAFTKEGAFNTKMLTLVGLDLQLDDQTDIAVDIPAGTRTVFTLFVGGIANSAKMLNTKALKAKRNR
jgi:hypothetical protein